MKKVIGIGLIALLVLITYKEDIKEVKVLKPIISKVLPEQKTIYESSQNSDLQVYSEEVKRYNAELVQTKDTSISAYKFKRERILKTSFKYPYIKTEEIIEAGKVISRIEMVADHVIVKSKSDLILKYFPQSTLIKISPDPEVELYRLSLSQNDINAVPNALEILKSIQVDAEPDYIRQTLLSPNDSAYVNGLLWGMNQSSDVDIDAPEAWGVRTSTDVIVAVIDTGIRYDHEDLASNMWRNPNETFNGLDDDSNGYIDDVFGIDTYNNDGNPMDDQNHGTHCSGSIGGVGNNSVGVVGVAWKVRIMALKFLSASGNGTDSDAIACIDYARLQGAKVLSCSWGGGAGGTTLSQAIDRARSSGIIVVCAAGNDATNNDLRPMYPASFPQDNIVSVASISRFNSLSFFSNYGASSVDLAAPGESIYSTIASSPSAYASYSGTSMATPHVAGSISLIIAQYSNEPYTSILNRLYSSTDTVSSLQGKVRYGRLNIAKALNASVSPSPEPDPTPVNPDPTPSPTNNITNDMFTNSITLRGSLFNTSGNNNSATKEDREPVHAFVGGGKSLWYSYTPSSTGMLTIDTRGSDFDTVLAIYTGSKVSFLQNTAYNDDFSRTEKTSRLVTKLSAGVKYYIAIDGYKGKTGNFKINGSYIGKTLLPAPTNIKLTRNGQRANIAWSRVVGATFYEVSITSGSTEYLYTTTQLSIIPPKLFSTTLELSTKVRAYDRDRDAGDWSSSISVRGFNRYEDWMSKFSNSELSINSNDSVVNIPSIPGDSSTPNPPAPIDSNGNYPWDIHADPDKDGKTNLQEYAFNSNPTIADNNTCTIVDNDHLSIQFQKRIDDPKLRYDVEVSQDLLNWGSNNTIQTSTLSTQGEYQTVIHRSITPKSNLNKQFMRVKVSYDNGY